MRSALNVVLAAIGVLLFWAALVILGLLAQGGM